MTKEEYLSANNPPIDLDSLRRLAVFLEGMKLGKGGNILPLGNYDLEQLWSAIRELESKN